MIDKSSVIFGNPQPKKVVKGAEKSKAKYIKKYGDDSNADYKISFKDIDTLDFIKTSNIVFGEENQKFEKNALIVGNIRMGFGHYRISIAMASAAKEPPPPSPNMATCEFLSFSIASLPKTSSLL